MRVSSIVPFSPTSPPQAPAGPAAAITTATGTATAAATAVTRRMSSLLGPAPRGVVGRSDDAAPRPGSRPRPIVRAWVVRSRSRPPAHRRPPRGAAPSSHRARARRRCPPPTGARRRRTTRPTTRTSAVTTTTWTTTHAANAPWDSSASPTTTVSTAPPSGPNTPRTSWSSGRTAVHRTSCPDTIPTATTASAAKVRGQPGHVRDRFIAAPAAHADRPRGAPEQQGRRQRVQTRQPPQPVGVVRHHEDEPGHRQHAARHRGQPRQHGDHAVQVVGVEGGHAAAPYRRRAPRGRHRRRPPAAERS